jgi:hypothetical protein
MAVPNPRSQTSYDVPGPIRVLLCYDSTVTLNLLKADSSKSSLRQKRLRAAVDNDFLLRLLTQV